MSYTRVNWTIDDEAMRILKSAQKSNSHRSLSSLVSHAILKTYKNPLEVQEELTKKLHSQWYHEKEKLDMMREERRDKIADN